MTTETATISPVQEEDMAKVKEIFQRALDAIIAATELSKTVQAMRADVDRLRQDIQDVQARNVELDRMLSDTRRQRDEAETALAQAKRDAGDSQHRLEVVQHDLDTTKDLLDIARTEIYKYRKEADEHFNTAYDIQSALDQANEKLKAMHAAMGVEFKPFAPEAKAAPAVVEAQPVPNPSTPSISPSSETYEQASSQGSVSPSEAQPARVYQDGPGFSWDKPYKWDPESRKYYQE